MFDIWSLSVLFPDESTNCLMNVSAWQILTEKIPFSGTNHSP